MNAHTWGRVEAVFGEALDLPPDEREAHVRRACAHEPEVVREVCRLLRAHERPSLLGQVAEDAARTLPRPAPTPGARLGRYTVVRRIGEGGMGAVYEAVQDTPQRTVALKLLRAGNRGPDARRRFQEEAEILGSLNHPAIARVYEAGALVDGDGAEHLFIAMELVEGAHDVVAFADERGLGPAERIGLMIEICRGVQHAHQKGVIHRDLKPGNVLVGADGRPRIIDFGVARAAGRKAPDLTQAGQVLGTPAYMSPEHLSADARAVDTRSDVYALGGLLYELLVGAPPVDVRGRSLLEIAALVREAAPPLPERLPEDLRWILATAMAKEPDRRYASASELADDLRRHLRHEPVLARPPSRLYRLRRFVRRRRLPLAAAACVFVALAAGLLREQRQRLLAEAARAEAAASLGRARATISFLTDVFTQVFPEQDGREARIADALDRGVRRLEGLSDADLRANLQLVIGDCYVVLGLPREGLLLLRAAHEHVSRSLPPGDAHALSTSTDYALALVAGGEIGPALVLLRELLPRSEEALGPLHETTLRASTALGGALTLASAFEEAIAALRTSCARHVQALGPSSRVTLGAQRLLGVALSQAGRHEEAIAILHDALAGFRATCGPDHPDTRKALHDLATALGRRGRSTEAVPILRDVLATQLELEGENHPATFLALANLGAALDDVGERAEALALYQRAIAVAQAVWGDGTAQSLPVEANLALLLLREGRAAEAEASCWALLERGRRLGLGDDLTMLTVWLTLGEALGAQGAFARCEVVSRATLGRSLEVLGGQHAVTLGLRVMLARAVAELDRPEAQALADEALAACEEHLGADDPATAAARLAVARAAASPPAGP